MEKTNGKENKKQMKISKQNMWMIASVVLGALLVISVVSGGLTGFATAGVSKEAISDRILNLIELDSPGLNPIVDEIGEESGIYKIDIEIEGQIIPFYTSKDGKYLISGMNTFDEIEEYLTLSSQQETQVAQQAVPIDYESEDLDDFISCLAQKGVVIYGANWCGYTNALINNLGGYTTVEPIYFECSGNEQVCSQEHGVTGYPTVKLNGEVVNPQRTIEGFAAITGCSAPNVGIQQSTNPEAGC